MDSANPVIQLCIQGTQAEFRKEIRRARACYQQAWERAENDYEACIAAHYQARNQDDPETALRWNAEALRRAEAASAAGDDARVAAFYPSLYLNMGQSLERLGKQTEAERYYALAAALGYPHRDQES